MAINVQRIALTREKLHFLYCSVRGVLEKYLGPFSVILRQSNFCEVESTNISGARKTASKVKKTLRSFGI